MDRVDDRLAPVHVHTTRPCPPGVPGGGEHPATGCLEAFFKFGAESGEGLHVPLEVAPDCGPPPVGGRVGVLLAGLPLNGGIVKLGDRLQIAPLEGFICRPHDLHVLLRHRLRSISPERGGSQAARRNRADRRGYEEVLRMLAEKAGDGSVSALEALERAL